MSCKGNYYDHAVTVTVFKTMINEWIYGTSYAEQQELRISVFEYVALFFNRKRMHSAMGCLAPAEFM